MADSNVFDQFDQKNPFDKFDAAPKKTVGALDVVKAGMAGANRGFYADLLGLPVDTAANVMDLGKAAIGLGYNEAKKLVTGKPSAPPEWTQPYDRSQVPGTSEWIAKKIGQGANALGMQSPVENPNPDDAASRIVFSGGRVAGASVVPSPKVPIGLRQQAANTGMGLASGLLSGSVGEVAPEWAGVAGLVPQAAGAASIAATKGLVRGGEQGRQKMAQRIQDFKNAGVDNPSLGLASGNSLVQGIENMLSVTPGSVGTYEKNKQAMLSGMQNKANQIRDAVSTEFGPVVAGEAIHADLKGAFKNRINATERKLLDKVAASVGNDFVVPIDASISKATELSTPIKGAEASSAQLINPRIAELAQNLKTDAYGAIQPPARALPGNPTLNVAVTPEVKQRTATNAALLNIPVELTEPLAQLSLNDPTRRAQSPPTSNPSLWNAPTRTVANPSLWNATAESITPMAQREGPNPTLNLPLTKKVQQEVVANPSLWNIPVEPINPTPQRTAVDGNPTLRVSIPNASLLNKQKQKGIPFGALKALRSDIGQEAASNAIIGTPEQAQFKQLYGAMSDDMKRGVAAADRAQAGVPVGPLTQEQQPGLSALSRANNFYSKAMNRVEDLNSLANRSTPEGAYTAVSNSLNAGPTVYDRLRGAVTPETRQKVVSTIIDEMGMTAPGQQGAAGDAWSPRTFLTNYAKLHENGGGDALFKRLPGGQKHAENLNDIAKAAEMVSQASKVWANPSGTAPAIVARGALGTIGAGLAGGLFYTPLLAPAATAAGGLLAANQVSQRLLLNPKFANWLAEAPKIRPQDVQAHAQRLIATAKMTNDKQFQKDVADYLNSVESQVQGE